MLLLWTMSIMEVEPKFKFGQDHNSPGVLVMSVLVTGGLSGLRIQGTSHVNKDSTSIAVFLLFFMELIKLLVAETKKY